MGPLCQYAKLVLSTFNVLETSIPVYFSGFIKVLHFLQDVRSSQLVPRLKLRATHGGRESVFCMDRLSL